MVSCRQKFARKTLVLVDLEKGIKIAASKQKNTAGAQLLHKKFLQK